MLFRVVIRPSTTGFIGAKSILNLRQIFCPIPGKLIKHMGRCRRPINQFFDHPAICLSRIGVILGLAAYEMVKNTFIALHPDKTIATKARLIKLICGFIVVAFLMCVCV